MRRSCIDHQEFAPAQVHRHEEDRCRIHQGHLVRCYLIYIDIERKQCECCTDYVPGIIMMLGDVAVAFLPASFMKAIGVVPKGLLA